MLDVYANSFSPALARLWDSLSAECFHLPCDLIAVSLDQLSLVSFQLTFLYSCHVCLLRFRIAYPFQWLFSLKWSESQFSKIYVNLR